MVDKEQTPRKVSVSTGKALAAVAAPEAAIPLAIAGKAADVAGKVLTGDVVVVRTLKNIGTKRNPIWRETEVHYNAVAIGWGALLVALGMGFATLAYEGVQLPWGQTPAFRDNVDRFFQAGGVRGLVSRHRKPKSS